MYRYTLMAIRMAQPGASEKSKPTIRENGMFVYSSQISALFF